MLDPFTKARLVRLVKDHKSRHGRDLSASELAANGISEQQIKEALREKIVVRYQVQASSGAVENRYKLHINWKGLNTE